MAGRTSQGEEVRQSAGSTTAVKGENFETSVQQDAAACMCAGRWGVSVRLTSQDQRFQVLPPAGIPTDLPVATIDAWAGGRCTDQEIALGILPGPLFLESSE